MAKRRNTAIKALAAAICLSAAFSLPAYATWGSDDAGRGLDTGLTDETSTSTEDVVPVDEAEQQRQKEKDAVASENQSKADKKAEYNSQLDDLQTKLDKLAADQKKIQTELNGVTGQKQQNQAIKGKLSENMNILMQQMDALNKRIEILNNDIALTEENIGTKKKDINSSVLLLRQRIATSYKTGYSSPLSVVLGAETYYDSLVRTKVIQQISARDKEMIDTLQAQKSDLEQEEKDLKSKQASLEADKADLEVNKISVSKQIGETNEKMEDILKLEQDYMANLAESKKLAQDMENEIANVYAKIKNLSSSATSEYVGGEMAWPLPGFTTISSNYGWRFNNSDFHTGVDITGGGVMGNTIVAANAGTVVVANLSFVPGRGYGKYVMIDHGGGMTTLYGHCNELLVSEGQVVARGEGIARVGTTGWSTGPHLHFEIRKDGAHTNPLPYLKG